ncbi:MAG TPA: hypothetical protein P5117_07510, partial [Spirochaetia bacterium]|nr:hypothetical protein [Spirochaetia bacterium]
MDAAAVGFFAVGLADCFGAGLAVFEAALLTGGAAAGFLPVFGFAEAGGAFEGFLVAAMTFSFVFRMDRLG